MTHIITSLCLRDGACTEVCPVDCIIPGFRRTNGLASVAEHLH